MDKHVSLMGPRTDASNSRLPTWARRFPADMQRTRVSTDASYEEAARSRAKLMEQTESALPAEVLSIPSLYFVDLVMIA